MTFDMEGICSVESDFGWGENFGTLVRDSDRAWTACKFFGKKVESD